MFFFSITVSFLADQVLAKVYLSPTNGGSLSTEGVYPFYYFVNTSSFNDVPTSPAFIDFDPIQITANTDNDTKFENYVEINFRSENTLTVTAPQRLVVALQLVGTSGTSSTTPIFAPIAAADGKACDDFICQSRTTSPVYNSVRWYAAVYQGTKANLKIGFYPEEACREYRQKTGTSAQGCATATAGILEPTKGAPTALSIQIGVYTIADSNATTQLTSTTPLDKLDTPISLNFGIDTPTQGCPDPTYIAYKGPQDGKIILNQTVFGVSGGNAPLRRICVVARDQNARGDVGTQPVVDKTFKDSGVNDVVSCQDNQGSTSYPFTGFTNTSDTDPHIYNASFILQDSTGIYVPPNNAQASGCYLSPVGASALEVAVPKDECFIATAAFTSIESSPVVLLRQFRNQFLYPFDSGRAFVEWYYSWSPRAAQWLNEHPVFRLPVLLYLAPLEAAAWVSVHAKAFFAKTFFDKGGQR